MGNKELDIWAESNEKEILVMECKKTQKKIGIKEVKSFVLKIRGLEELAYKVTAIYYSEIGFTKSAEKFMIAEKIMWTNKEKWEQ